MFIVLVDYEHWGSKISDVVALFWAFNNIMDGWKCGWVESIFIFPWYLHGVWYMYSYIPKASSRLEHLYRIFCLRFHACGPCCMLLRFFSFFARSILFRLNNENLALSYQLIFFWPQPFNHIFTEMKKSSCSIGE